MHEREAGALDQHESQRAPPGQAGRAHAVQRQIAQVERRRAVSHDSSSGVPFGQNQPISATATGIEPQTTAHGVKIDQISITLVAIAASSGQIELARRGFARLRPRLDQRC